MTFKEFEKKLKEIDDRLFIDGDRIITTDSDYEPNIWIYCDIGSSESAEIYNLSTNQFNLGDSTTYISGNKFKQLKKLILKFNGEEKSMDNQTKLIENIKNHLSVINHYREEDGYFELIIKSNCPAFIVLNHDGNQPIIYNFEMKNFIYPSLILISDSEFYALQNEMNYYWQKSNDFQTIPNDSESKKRLNNGICRINIKR